MARILRIVVGAVGFVLYAWVAGVHNLPRVKARKRARVRTPPAASRR